MHNRDDVFKPFYLVKMAHVEYTFKLPESSDPPESSDRERLLNPKATRVVNYFRNFTVKTFVYKLTQEVFVLDRRHKQFELDRV